MIENDAELRDWHVKEPAGWSLSVFVRMAFWAPLKIPLHPFPWHYYSGPRDPTVLLKEAPFETGLELERASEQTDGLGKAVR